MTKTERAELKRLRLRRAFCGVDQRYRRWDAVQEARYRELLLKEASLCAHPTT